MILKKLFMLEREYNYYLNKEIKKFKIKKNDIRTIKIINENKGISQNEICNMLKEDKVTIAKSVKKLEERGYITRSKEDEDKRISSIYLTNEGREVRRETIKIMDRLNEILLKDIDRDEIELFKSVLSKISDNMFNNSTRLK